MTLSTKKDKGVRIMSKVIHAAGIDLTDEYAQISYILSGESEPQSLTVNPEEKRYLIPALLYYREENDTWYAGDEALFNSATDRRSVFGFDSHIKYDRDKMTKYLELLIKLLTEMTEADIDGVICVSEEDSDLESTGCIYSAMKNLGYDDERVRVINHDEAFIYYTINQRKELWVNDVLLFDFTKKHFKYRRFHEIKGRTPSIITVSCEDYSDDIYFKLIDTELGRLKADRLFMEIAMEEMKKHIVCTSFLTGSGFYKEWGEETIREMCERRKVFKGYNLYVKGACFAAMKKYDNTAPRRHIFQCKGRTIGDVGLAIENQGKNMVISLSESGTNWYEAGAEAECIIDNTDRIKLVMVSSKNTASYEKYISLKDFPKRPNKTTKVKITLGYKNDNDLEIIVKDMGFGELFKASGITVKETVNMKELFS